MTTKECVWRFGRNWLRYDGEHYFKASIPLYIYTWEAANGLVPKGWHVHHIDGDKINDDLSNLQLMEGKAHRRLHALESGLGRNVTEVPLEVAVRVDVEKRTRKFNKNWGRRGKYFVATLTLHTYTWERANGIKPEGYHIHHVDGDSLNNDLGNLQLMEAREHCRYHVIKRGFGYSTTEAQWKAMREKAAMWHRSDEGRAWHSVHGKETWVQRSTEDRICDQCGDTYETYFAKRGGRVAPRFCSNKCKSAARRASGVDNEDRVCEQCGETFSANKYEKTRFCSRACGKAPTKKPLGKTICPICGEPFEHRLSAKRKYCSRLCQYAAMRKSPSSVLSEERAAVER